VCTRPPRACTRRCPGKPLDAFGGGTTIPKDELLYLPCDVLIPAAIGGVITEDNAARLACQFVVEAANGPTTPGVSGRARARVCVRVRVRARACEGRWLGWGGASSRARV
jgi:glutamate dehydrogenase/leucine dehydrogenase